jgi:thymidylate synthase
MSLWQEEELRGVIGLPPCAFQTLWTVRGEFLDCTLVQRSQDILGANNINNIQYVALQMMVAKHCGLKPGKFTHFIQNVHIYDRHIPIAKEILQRPISEKQPKLIFEPKSNNFYDFTIDDFKVVDYEPQGKIFIPIAI